MHNIVCVLALFLLFRPATGAEGVSDVLHKQTQELFDAIPTGSATVWKRYLDDNASYTDETGAVQSKQQMITQLKPFPKEISGSVKVTDFKVTLHGPVAIATHLDDEHETYYGQNLHSQYRSTDTWLKTAAGWRLIAAQVLALRSDPPPSSLSVQQMHEYVGRYALTPSKIYEIRSTNGRLEGRETGREPETLLAELPDLLFVPGKPRYRKVILRDSRGQITGFAERREAWDLVWKRVP